jgi:Predicted O-linked N-acetylglucosamine transferase, SPINDLY family
LANRVITFGSFNRLVKVSDKAYSAWAQILLALPLSRLILKTGELDNVAARERVVNHFTKVGIAANRIVMQGSTSWYEHMQTYCQIDIVLDPFPQGGGVTALESLMMGVPIINLRGASVAGRSSASIMTTLGLSDWIAENSEQYVELAIQKHRTCSLWRYFGNNYVVFLTHRCLATKPLIRRPWNRNTANFGKSGVRVFKIVLKWCARMDNNLFVGHRQLFIRKMPEKWPSEWRAR